MKFKLKNVKVSEPYHKLWAQVEPASVFNDMFQDMIRSFTCTLYSLSTAMGMGIYHYQGGQCPKEVLDDIEKNWGYNDLRFAPGSKVGKQFKLDYVMGRGMKFSVDFRNKEANIFLMDHKNPVECLKLMFKNAGHELEVDK